MRGRGAAWWSFGLGAYSAVVTLAIAAHLTTSTAAIPFFAVTILVAPAGIVVGIVALVRGRLAVALPAGLGIALGVVGIVVYWKIASALASGPV